MNTRTNMNETKVCLVCGRPLKGKQLKYCSKKCTGIGKQGYKICPVCGKKFPEWEQSSKICCSPECSKKHRESMHKKGLYQKSISKMREGFAEKVKSVGRDNLWTAKGWVIQSPDGKIYECHNLLNFIRENPELFDGTAKQAFDGFARMKATMQGKRKKGACYSWKGWKLISWSD